MDIHAPDFTDHVCLICGRRCANRRSLGNHLARSHISDTHSIRLYVLRFFCAGNLPPLCSCGCGERVEWHSTHYAFNRFVNGHNSGSVGFCAPGYKPTAEQIEKRNTAIRHAYATRPEISSKIGDAINKRFSKDPSFAANLKSGALARWAKPGAKEIQSAAQREKWAQDHDARYARVFTEEFARKISAANARRDCKRTSKIELEFVDKLRSLLPAGDVEPSKWFNFGERHVCTDAWSRSLGAAFELDGHFWHGLDRRSDFTPGQLHNMAADLRKDLLFAAKNATVYRFGELADGWRTATSIEQLLASSRHRMVNGVIERDGLFTFDDDDHPVLTRDALLRLGRQKRQELLEPLVDFVGAYVERRGFFYPKCDDKLADVVRAIGAGQKTAGSAFLQSRFRSFWHVAGGAVDTCLNDSKLHQVLAYRIGLNSSKPYEYELDGVKITSNEMFDVTPKQIRRGCTVQRKGVSWFRPQWAAHAWSSLLQDVATDRPLVWDPSAGFGARMLGLAAIRPAARYAANEPATLTLADNELLSAELRGFLPDFNASVIRNGSEVTSGLQDGTADAAFTSPPFFDRERYFDEPGQCWRDHPTLEQWSSDYVVPTLLNVERALRSGGRLTLHLPDDLVELFVGLAGACCSRLERTIDFDSTLLLRADHFARKHGHTASRHEAFITWIKL